MTGWTVYTNANLFFDKKKKRKLANIWSSLHFYGMIILVKTKPLCKGMAWLPFQKCFEMWFELEMGANLETSECQIYLNNRFLGPGKV